jgi:tetratricopeptide (TPR) repeat protein
LIDSTTGAHLWADRFDGTINDVFDLQDQITTSVVGQLVSRVQIEEEERALRKPTTSLDAYDYYLRGTANLWKWSKEGHDTASAHFSKAIELDHNFALAHASLCRIFNFRKQSRWMIDVAGESAAAVHHARRAIELGREDAVALAEGGFTLAYIAEELEVGADCIARSLSMNSNLALGWHLSGWVNIYLGRHETALQHLATAERLSPRDPLLVQNRMACALANVLTGHYEEAERLTELITSEVPGLFAAWRMKAISYALGGHPESAAAAARRLLELDPSARVSILAPPLRRPEDRQRYREGLLRAGLSE